MSSVFNILEVLAVLIVILGIVRSKRKKNEKGENHKRTSNSAAAQGAFTNMLTGGHEHFGNKREEDAIHAALDSAKSTGLINLNGKLYTKEQLRGL